MDNYSHCGSTICLANECHWPDVWYTGITELSFCYLKLCWIILNYINQCSSIIISLNYKISTSLLEKLLAVIRHLTAFEEEWPLAWSQRGCLLLFMLGWSSAHALPDFFLRRKFVLDTNTLAMCSYTLGLAGVMSLSLASGNNSDITHGCFSHQLFSFWVEDFTIFWWLDLEF